MFVLRNHMTLSWPKIPGLFLLPLREVLRTQCVAVARDSYLRKGADKSDFPSPLNWGEQVEVYFPCNYTLPERERKI